MDETEDHDEQANEQDNAKTNGKQRDQDTAWMRDKGGWTESTRPPGIDTRDDTGPTVGGSDIIDTGESRSQARIHALTESQNEGSDNIERNEVEETENNDELVSTGTRQREQRR